MAKKYIIVKYAQDNFQEGKAPASMSVYDTYSAKEVGVTQQFYNSEEEAKADLRKLSNYNLGVSYGIVESL